MDEGDWREDSRAAVLAKVGWTRTYVWLHTATTAKNLLAARFLVDSPVPSTSALALRAALESAALLRWTLADGDDRCAHARALTQAAREISLGTRASHPDAFRTGPGEALAAAARQLGFEVEEKTQADGRVVVHGVGGERRPKFAKVIGATFPGTETIYSSLSALAHGEAWRVCGANLRRTADGYEHAPDTLLAGATHETVRVALQILADVTELTGRTAADQPWYRTPLARAGELFDDFGLDRPVCLSW